MQESCLVTRKPLSNRCIILPRPKLNRSIVDLEIILGER